MVHISAFCAAGVLSAVLLSQVSWYLVESPFLALKSRFVIRGAPASRPPALTLETEAPESP